MKCLTIACEMLKTTDSNELTPQLQMLVETLVSILCTHCSSSSNIAVHRLRLISQVLPGITNEDPAVRNIAVRCLGLCCYLDVPTANKHLILFTQVRGVFSSNFISSLSFAHQMFLLFLDFADGRRSCEDDRCSRSVRLPPTVRTRRLRS